MNLTGKQLEQLCTYRMDGEQKRGRGFMGRAGVAGASLIGQSKLVKDTVDFRGEADGVPFKMEAKTTTEASFSLHEVFFKRGQYEELKAFDGVAFVLVHYNPRRLAKIVTDARTFAFPVWPGHEFWQRYESGEAKSIGRYECDVYAVAVEWNVFKGCRKLCPDIVGAVKQLEIVKVLRC